MFVEIKITVIYPATEKHIDKYSIRDKHLVLETPILYENVTEPYLKSTQFSLDVSAFSLQYHDFPF